MPTIDVPIKRKIIDEKINKPFAGRPDSLMTAEEGVARLRKGMFGFMMEDSTMFKIMEDTFYEHEKCGLVLMEFHKFSAPYLCLKRNSPYKEIMRVK